MRLLEKDGGKDPEVRVPQRLCDLHGANPGRMRLVQLAE
jgi:hypothetical protein